MRPPYTSHQWPLEAAYMPEGIASRIAHNLLILVGHDARPACRSAYHYAHRFPPRNLMVKPFKQRIRQQRLIELHSASALLALSGSRHCRMVVDKITRHTLKQLGHAFSRPRPPRHLTCLRNQCGFDSGEPFVRIFRIESHLLPLYQLERDQDLCGVFHVWQGDALGDVIGKRMPGPNHLRCASAT